MNALKSLIQVFSVLTFAVFATGAAAQERQPSYGQDITIANAKKVAQAALAEAQKNSWNVAIAIVDNHGSLVYFERMDDTQTASPVIAIEKARTAAMFRRPTRAMEDMVNKGRVALLGIPVATPIIGGLPIIVGGKVIGGIGVSGVTSDQDSKWPKPASRDLNESPQRKRSSRTDPLGVRVCHPILDPESSGRRFVCSAA